MEARDEVSNIIIDNLHLNNFWTPLKCHLAMTLTKMRENKSCFFTLGTESKSNIRIVNHAVDC